MQEQRMQDWKNDPRKRQRLWKNRHRKQRSPKTRRRNKKETDPGQKTGRDLLCVQNRRKETMGIYDPDDFLYYM